jgi:glycosyltransferase involved in cell wall biosynthesis
MDDATTHMEPGYLLYVGSLSRRKNIHGVLAVAIRLAREDGLATLIVGGGSDILAPITEEIPADIAHLVRFTGPVTDLAALGRLYRNAACLLFPSFYEASPLPPVEAMHFGCPVVVSAIPAMTERCGTAAVYCDPHCVDGMAAAVRQVMRDPADRAARGRRHSEHWTWRDQAGQVLTAILGSQQDVRQHVANVANGGTGGESEKAQGDGDEDAGGFILPGQQAPSPRSTHGTVSTRMRTLSASDRERA